jgi:RNA polymerase-binding transcription factor DksA
MTTPTASSYVRLERKLIQRRTVLQAEVAATLLRIDADRYSALAGQVHDTKDHSIAESLIATGNAEVQRDAEELQDIEAALERMSVGSYGKCVMCGTVIPEDRLSAYPTAKRCLPCQTEHEKSR